jgi:hypothetical protein
VIITLTPDQLFRLQQGDQGRDQTDQRLRRLQLPPHGVQDSAGEEGLRGIYTKRQIDVIFVSRDIFSEKIGENVGVFNSKKTADVCKKIIVTLILKEIAFFPEKKGGNCIKSNYNIGSR